MTPDTGILTTLLNNFQDAFTGGFSKIYPDAMSLLAILSLLEIAIAAVWWSISEDNAIASFLKKCIQIGLFIFVVTKYQSLIGLVLDGFISTGLKAGGGGSKSLILDPSAIIDMGFTATNPIFDHLKQYAGIDSIANLPDIIMSGISGILVLLAYFAMGIQIFVTYLEFYLVSVLGLILIPFGVFKHTSFICEKVFGAIISFGIRLMVLAFILSVASPALAQIALPADPNWPQVFTMLLAALTIMGLSWHAPGIASGLIAGSPSLTAGAAAGITAAAGAGLAGTSLGSSAAARGAARLGVSATRAGAFTTGAVTAAARLGASEAPGRVLSQSAGAVKGVGGLIANSARSTYEGVVGGIKEAYKEGEAKAIGPPTIPAPSSPTGANSSMPAWARKIKQAQNAIPQEAQPGAGMHVPIKHHD